MSHDLREIVKNSKNNNSLKLSRTKSESTIGRVKSISLTPMKYQVAATRTHPGFYIVVVETAHADRGTITNHRGKQATKRPNAPQIGHHMYVATAEEQSGDQSLSLTKCFQSTHLTPMHKGDTFGDLCKIVHRIGSLGLIP
jgi:hypothetical protein